MKKLYFAFASLLLIGAGCFNPSPTAPPPANVVNDFESCVAAGNPVMESYPEQCAHEGVTYTRDIGTELEHLDLIRVSSPRPGETVSSPVTIVGEARGYWFFEASFPITLLDDEGNILGTAVAQAQDDWMTEEFVPFEATLEYEAAESGTGVLYLEKDNPSGLIENYDRLDLPVKFEASVE